MKISNLSTGLNPKSLRELASRMPNSFARVEQIAKYHLETEAEAGVTVTSNQAIAYAWYGLEITALIAHQEKVRTNVAILEALATPLQKRINALLEPIVGTKFRNKLTNVGQFKGEVHNQDERMFLGTIPQHIAKLSDSKQDNIWGNTIDAFDTYKEWHSIQDEIASINQVIDKIQVCHTQ